MAASRPLAVYHQRAFWTAGPLLHLLETSFSPLREQYILIRHSVWCNWQLLMLCLSIRDNLSQLSANLAGEQGAGMCYPKRGAGPGALCIGHFQPFLCPRLGLRCPPYLYFRSLLLGQVGAHWTVVLRVMTQLTPSPRTGHLWRTPPGGRSL